MDMTRQGDPSTSESPGGGYKTAMVAIYGQAFHIFLPFILVRNHRSFYSYVSQTLVRPCKDQSPHGFWRLSRSVVQCHKVLYGLRTPNNDGRIGTMREQVLQIQCCTSRELCASGVHQDMLAVSSVPGEVSFDKERIVPRVPTGELIAITL
ncbi:hypothetical protein BDM02DRAFT_2115486 [Thelephora ganbajun]|uniref:Uncharacterized protein n=1 Tax=Thelephora ganbajun TaxID=370292 RepID=A0ACB6ZU71_THEGA|nr:hypothetical protein BDM02DRAFT_2115486 [Thelephora ganbajun]